MEFKYEGNSLKSGVYKITNKVNNKIYIGSAKEFKRRASQHLSSLEKGKHQNKHLQASFNKHGSDAFIFEAIEVVEGDTLARTTVEQKYLDEQIQLENWENCFNFAKKTVKKQGPWSNNPTQATQKIIEKRKNNWFLFLSPINVEYVVEDLNKFSFEVKLSKEKVQDLLNKEDIICDGWKRIKWLSNNILINQKSKEIYKISAGKTLIEHSKFLQTNSSHLSKLLSGKRKSINNWIIKDRKIIANYRGKTYKLLSPSGDVVEFNNLKHFAKENNLDRTSLFSLLLGKRKNKFALSHKGWRSVDMIEGIFKQQKKESYINRYKNRLKDKISGKFLSK